MREEKFEGFISLHRKIKDSAISKLPPCTRETWQYLLLNANYSDRVSSGRLIHRGQLVRTYKEVQEALSWKVGYRTDMYSEKQIGTAFKHLRKEGMITTQHTVIGQIITICKFNFYQNPDNFKMAAKDKRSTSRKRLRREDTQFDKNFTGQGFDETNQDMKVDAKEKRREGNGRTINNNGNNDNNEIKKNNTYTTEQKCLFSSFENWVLVNAPTVSKMKRPFTIDEYFTLKNRAGTKRLYSIIEDMENYEKIKNYSSAYNTFLAFFKKQGGETSKLSSIPKLPLEEQKEAIIEEMKNRKLVI